MARRVGSLRACLIHSLPQHSLRSSVRLPFHPRQHRRSAASGVRKSTPEHTARSLLVLDAWASATLEGSSFDVDELALKVAERDRKGCCPSLDSVARAAAHVAHLAGASDGADPALAAAGSVADEDLGRPVNPEGVKRLQALGDMVKEKTEAPALVVAALAHAEIIAAGAFISHNAVVARAVEALALWIVASIRPR